LNWDPAAIEITSAAQSSERLKQICHAIEVDVVVMTQACDLEHDHLTNVVLCPYLGLWEHKALWEEFMRARGQNPSPKAWRNYCDDIQGGGMAHFERGCRNEPIGVKIELWNLPQPREPR
jgi:hypothetical protein